MLLNNRAQDLRNLLFDSGMNQVQYADKFDEDCGNVANIVNRHGPTVSRRFIEMCENLGYDIRLEYVKRRVEKV